MAERITIEPDSSAVNEMLRNLRTAMNEAIKNASPEKLANFGFSYDSSLRYSKDRIDDKEMGYSRINGIIEFPVTLMDAYLFTYMKIQEDKIIPEFQKTLDLGRSLSENNVISVLWHDNVLKMKGGRMYKQILEFLTSQDDVEIKRGADLVKIFS